MKKFTFITFCFLVYITASAKVIFLNNENKLQIIDLVDNKYIETIDNKYKVQNFENLYTLMFNNTFDQNILKLTNSLFPFPVLGFNEFDNQIFYYTSADGYMIRKSNTHLKLNIKLDNDSLKKAFYTQDILFLLDHNGDLSYIDACMNDTSNTIISKNVLNFYIYKNLFLLKIYEDQSMTFSSLSNPIFDRNISTEDNSPILSIYFSEDEIFILKNKSLYSLNPIERRMDKVLTVNEGVEFQSFIYSKEAIFIQDNTNNILRFDIKKRLVNAMVTFKSDLKSMGVDNDLFYISTDYSIFSFNEKNLSPKSKLDFNDKIVSKIMTLEN